MDIIENAKIKIDMISMLRDIFGEKKSAKKEDETDKKLEQIYKVETEIGATESIVMLEQNMQKHEVKEKTKKTETKNIKTTANNSREINTSKDLNNIEKDLDQDNFLER